ARVHTSLSAPADRRWRRRCGSASGSGGVRAVSAARAAPWGRLETVQKVLTRALGAALGRLRAVRHPPADLGKERAGLQLWALGTTGLIRSGSRALGVQ